MSARQVGILGLLGVCLVAGCSRPQPGPKGDASASTAAGSVEGQPSNEHPQATTARASSTPEKPHELDPNRVKVYAMMMVLGYAADKYRETHHEFPPSLDLIVNAREALIDPWGRPYHYDRKGEHNGGQHPDIWSEGIDPTDPSAILSNWDGVEN
jgi:hypothetical protein